jgi:hypothetical protein
MTPVLLLLAVLAQAPAPTPASSKVWIGHEAEFENFLRTAPIVKTETVKIGVTKPHRIYFAPGGPAASAAWKPIAPGIHGGYYDSYKSEIAAYEMDKILHLGMVPVAVERRIDGDLGAVILWLEGVKPWETAIARPSPPSFEREKARMKLFDDFIGNHDRNKGNLLVDDACNLYLIDHSRAFDENRRLAQSLDHVDSGLWDSILALDEPTLKARTGEWVSNGQIKAMLARRETMKKDIDALIKKNGRRAVMVW